MLVPTIFPIVVGIVVNALQIGFPNRLRSVELMIGCVHLPIYPKCSYFWTRLLKPSKNVLDRFGPGCIEEFVSIDEGDPRIVDTIGSST